MIAIVDTGGANHTSIQDALLRLGCESEVTVDSARIRASSHVILPGVGHAAFAMDKLRNEGLIDVIAKLEQPVLGICLGMQLLFSSSEEGDAVGLGILPGRVTRLEAHPDFRVPHMGWNQLQRTARTSRLLSDIDPQAYFYFVHSYRVPSGEWTVAESQAPHSLPAVIEARNFMATQFHPERSSTHGARLLQNFLNLRSAQ